jgi:hypothetical protein
MASYEHPRRADHIAHKEPRQMEAERARPADGRGARRQLFIERRLFRAL